MNKLKVSMKTPEEHSRDKVKTFEGPTNAVENSDLERNYPEKNELNSVIKFVRNILKITKN